MVAKEALVVPHVQVLSAAEVVLLFIVQVVQVLLHFLDSCATQLWDLHRATYFATHFLGSYATEEAAQVPRVV